MTRPGLKREATRRAAAWPEGRKPEMPHKFNAMHPKTTDNSNTKGVA